MIIPVGLIAHLVTAGGSAQDDHLRGQWESYEREHAFEAEMMKQRAMGHEQWEACTGPAGCLLVLGDNDWASTEIDHVRLSGVASAASPAGGYRETQDPLGPGPHGLLAVCPGRHTVRTTVGGRPVDAHLTLFPGEAAFRRLDRASGTWTTYDPSEQEKILERLTAKQLVLLHYFQHVAEPRIKAVVGKLADEALREAMPVLRATFDAIVRADQAGAMKRVTAISKLLVGVPIPSFAPITAYIGFNAFALFDHGHHYEAWLLLQAGLAILPDDPTLLVALGELQLREGKTDEAHTALRRALDRQVGLEPAAKARALELLTPRPG